MKEPIGVMVIYPSGREEFYKDYKDIVKRVEKVSTYKYKYIYEAKELIK